MSKGRGSGRGRVSHGVRESVRVCVHTRADVSLRSPAYPGGTGEVFSPFFVLGGLILSGQGRTPLSPQLRVHDWFCALPRCFSKLGEMNWEREAEDSWCAMTCSFYQWPRPSILKELCAASGRRVLISPVQLWYNCAPMGLRD